MELPAEVGAAGDLRPQSDRRFDVVGEICRVRTPGWALLARQQTGDLCRDESGRALDCRAARYLGTQFHDLLVALPTCLRTQHVSNNETQPQSNHLMLPPSTC